MKAMKIPCRAKNAPSFWVSTPRFVAGGPGFADDTIFRSSLRLARAGCGLGGPPLLLSRRMARGPRR